MSSSYDYDLIADYYTALAKKKGEGEIINEGINKHQ
ncbi:hypothetical protein KKC_05362 [Listeria fleischmannii subsp. coloradonensis]|nr:hypothetical protein KKC_05362 [Listeria fleischmannii subsp. coloradonensis]STY35361.1 Uncharacterised protein [Listeria fleischmannii subsp. coloradonensis]